MTRKRWWPILSGAVLTCTWIPIAAVASPPTLRVGRLGGPCQWESLQDALNAVAPLGGDHHLLVAVVVGTPLTESVDFAPPIMLAGTITVEPGDATCTALSAADLTWKPAAASDKTLKVATTVPAMDGGFELIFRGITLEPEGLTDDEGFVVVDAAAVTFGPGSVLQSGVSLNPDGDSFGGCLTAKNSARVRLEGDVQVHTCRADKGGAIALLGGTADDRTSLLLVEDPATGLSPRVENNEANVGGGGLYAEGYSEAYFSGSSVLGNNRAPQGGGAWITNLATLSLAGYALIQGNVAVDSDPLLPPLGSAGGGVIVSDGAALYLDGDSAISDNQADYGGGVNVIAANSSVTLSARSRVGVRDAVGVYPETEGNRANRDGGGLFARVGAEITLAGGTGSPPQGELSTAWGAMVRGNLAGLEVGTEGVGGGVYLQAGARLNCANASIAGNTVGTDPDDASTWEGLGGGVYLDAATADLVDCTIHDNRAALGGGLALLPEASVEMRGQPFYKAMPDEDDLICTQITHLMPPSRTCSELYLNQARDDGGAAWVEADALLLLNRTTLRRNRVEVLSTTVPAPAQVRVAPAGLVQLNNALVSDNDAPRPDWPLPGVAATSIAVMGDAVLGAGRLHAGVTTLADEDLPARYYPNSAGRFHGCALGDPSLAGPALVLDPAAAVLGSYNVGQWTGSFTGSANLPAFLDGADWVDPGWAALPNPNYGPVPAPLGELPDRVPPPGVTFRDLAGHLRACGSFIDAGAYEYQVPGC